MKSLSANLPPTGYWKVITIWLSFLLFTSCLHDESVETNHHDDFSREPANADFAHSAAISAEVKTVFTAHLAARNEVAATPINSRGAGQVTFSLNEDGTALHYKLIVANTMDMTQAHIHCGPEGVNGPVVVFLFGFVPSGVTQNGILAEGTITSANIIARPSSLACVGGLATFENLLERMRNGTLYVNVHTLTCPGGEIRGQIQ